MLVLWFCIGGIFGLYAAALSAMFGAKYAGALFGASIGIEALSALVFAILSQNIHNWFNGWVNYCIFLGIIGVLCVIITVITDTRIDKAKYMKSRLLMKPTTVYQSVKGEV